MTKLKAYKVYLDEYGEGCFLVFGSTRNKARYYITTSESLDYVALGAVRVPEYDKWAVGKITYCIYSNSQLPKGAPPFYQETLKHKFPIGTLIEIIETGEKSYIAYRSYDDEEPDYLVCADRDTARLNDFYLLRKYYEAHNKDWLCKTYYIENELKIVK